MKRLLSLLLLLSLCLTLCGCTLSNRDYYERAQLYLGSGDFATAAELFSQLGEYEDSADYALYCAALYALQEGELDLARTNLTQVAPFKSSGRYLRMVEAMTLERSGDLEGALAAYDALGSFENSADAAERLRAAIPKKKLEHASALMDAGRYEQAKKDSFSLTKFTGIICVGLTVILVSVSGVFPSFYDTTDEIRRSATLFIIITALFFPVQGFLNALYFGRKDVGYVAV